MKPFTDTELLALLDDLESDRAERKEAWVGSAPEKARQAICAFANDLPGSSQPGVLFIGVKDNGTPSGLPITDQLELTLSDLKTDGKILPPPVLTVEKRTLKGAAVAVVTVWPADAPPVRYDGRIWIRVGPRRAIATGQEERILNEKRRFKDLPFDLHPLPSASFSELSRSRFEDEYLPRAFAPDILEANERTLEQRLAACRMVVSADQLTPTVLGVLTLGSSPRSWLPCAYIQFLRIRGTEWGDPIADEQDIDGTLALMLNRLDDKVKAHLTSAVDFTSGDLEQRKSPYPLAALQQLARNAVMHRTYEHTNAPIRFYWFDDRIEIHSPGGTFGVVTKENFGNPGVTDYRNPHVAEAMKVLGYVQKFGMGIATAQRFLKDNHNPPAAFTVEPTSVLATVRQAPLISHDHE
jgi:ATP-dependent DNA helicase RecG